MGLLNKRNIDKAKALAEKNKDKIAAGVSKATDTIDRKTGGKYSDKLHKVDDAAKKFAGTEDETATGDSTSDAPADTQPDTPPST